MKVLKWFALALCAWVGIVVAFESLIGALQPSDERTLVITTIDSDGNSHDRVLTRLERRGALYVAANHWPRRWYREALENPAVTVTSQGRTSSYRAVPVTGAEHDRVQEDHGTGFVFRFLTGFPPRKFVRLDPR